MTLEDIVSVGCMYLFQDVMGNEQEIQQLLASIPVGRWEGADQLAHHGL
jgi:hypothetical protein